MGGAARPSRAHAPHGRAKPLRPPPLSGVPGLDGLLGGASPDLVGATPRDALGAAGAGELVQHGHLRAGSSRTMWWTKLEPMTPKPPATIMRRSPKASIIRAPPRSQTPDATVASIRRETPYSSRRTDPPHVTKRPPAETARIAHQMPGSSARAMAGDTESPCPTRSSQHGPRSQGRPGPDSPSTGKPRGQLESPLGFGHHRQAHESPPPATTPHPRRPLRLVRSCLARQ